MLKIRCPKDTFKLKIWQLFINIDLFMYSYISMEAQYTKCTAAAFLKSSILCCLSLSYIYTKAAACSASNQTDLLNRAQQSFVLRWIRINMFIYIFVYIHSLPYTYRAKFPTTTWLEMTTDRTFSCLHSSLTVRLHLYSLLHWQKHHSKPPHNAAHLLQTECLPID